MSETNARTGPDRCPGALTVHHAADGAMARIRVPGGMLTPEQVDALAAAAQDLATPEIHLTGRGNVQLRAVRDPHALAERLGEAGLLPSATHEKLRNIVATPLAGRVGGSPVQHLVGALDTALLADPSLADLPGRILFTVDDGRGDVSGLGADIGLHAVDGRTALILAGRDSGVRVPNHAAVSTVLDAARAFTDIRSGHWRLAEIDSGVESVLNQLDVTPTHTPINFTVPERPPIGWIDQDDGAVALGAALEHGILPARTAQFLAATDRPLLLTPWRSIALVDLSEDVAEQVVRVLAPMGLIFDAESPWARVGSCVGSPGCARSHTDVRNDLLRAIIEQKIGSTGREHWSGCERRCGRPRGPVTDVVAGPDGYTARWS